MKRKLMKRNKNKLSIEWKKCGSYFYLLRRLRHDSCIDLFSYRYNEVVDYENAFYMFECSEWIFIPLVISSKKRKSRIQNKVYAYRSMTSIEEFNKEFGTNKLSTDIKVKKL